MRQSHLLIYNAVVIWVTRILRVFPELILVPFLIHRIGEAGYGVYALAWSLMLAIDMLQMGLCSGVIKHSAAFLAEKQIQEVNKVISTAFVYSIIFGLLACVSILLVVRLSGNLAEGLVFGLVLVALMALIVIPLTPYVGIILSLQRYDINAIADTLFRYIKVLLIVLWFKLLSPSLESLMVISVAVVILTRLVQVPIAYRLIPGLRNHPSLFRWQMFKILMSFGAMIILCTFCSILNNTGIKWLMGTMVSTAFVAHLVIMLTPALLLSQIVQAMTLTIMPAASKYNALGDYHVLSELFIRGTRYGTLLVTAGIMAAVLSMRSVLVVWVGSEYEFLAPFAIIIFCGVSFLMSTSCAHHMLRGMGMLRVSLLNSVVGLVVVPVLSIMIILLVCKKPYLAVATSLCLGSVVNGLMQLYFCTKAVRVSYRKILLRAYGKPLMVAIPVSTLAFGFVTYGSIESLGGRMFVSAVAGFLFGVVFYLLFFTAAERTQAKECYQLVLDRAVSLRRKMLRDN